VSNFRNVDWDFFIFFFFLNLRSFMRQIKSQKLLMLRFVLVFLVLNGNLWCKPGLFETNSVEGVVIKISNHPFLDFMFELFDIFPLRLFFTFTFSIIVFLEDSK